MDEVDVAEATERPLPGLTKTVVTYLAVCGAFVLMLWGSTRIRC